MTSRRRRKERGQDEVNSGGPEDPRGMVIGRSAHISDDDMAAAHYSGIGTPVKALDDIKHKWGTMATESGGSHLHP